MQRDELIGWVFGGGVDLPGDPLSRSRPVGVFQGLSGQCLDESLELRFRRQTEVPEQDAPSGQELMIKLIPMCRSPALEIEPFPSGLDNLGQRVFGSQSRG